MKLYSAFVLCCVCLLITSGCHHTQKQSTTSRATEVICLPPTVAETSVYDDYVDDNHQVVPVSLSRDFMQKTPWNLTLQEAVVTAMEHNKNIAVVRHVPQIDHPNIAIETSEFDTDLSLGGQWQRTDRLVANASSGSGVGIPQVQTDLFGSPAGLTDQLGVTKRWETGTRTSAYYGSNYNMTNPGGNFLLVNPSWATRLNFQIEQPLFKDNGRDVNRLGIEIARANYNMSYHDFRKTVSELIRDVEVAYWDITVSQTNVESRETGVRQSARILQAEEGKLANGMSAVQDVAQAREQYESLRAEAVEARQSLANSERALRQLMGIRAEDGRRIVPISDLTENMGNPDWESGLIGAMHTRPELTAQRAAIRSSYLALRRACNNLDHDLSAFAGYTLNGLNSEYDKSVETLTGNQYTDWSLGFRYERRLGQRGEKARVHQAEHQLSKDRAQLKNLKHIVQNELHEAHQAIHSTREQMEHQQRRLEASKMQLRAHAELYKQGQGNLDLFLRSQLSYLNAMRDNARALAEYNQALARWSYATGGNLEHPGYTVLSDEEETAIDNNITVPAPAPDDISR